MRIRSPIFSGSSGKLDSTKNKQPANPRRDPNESNHQKSNRDQFYLAIKINQALIPIKKHVIPQLIVFKWKNIVSFCKYYFTYKGFSLLAKNL